MKCPECGGVGRIHYGEEWCSACNGTGEIVTNEEWLRSCNTEQLAEFLTKFILDDKRFRMTMVGGVNETKLWLKQPHQGAGNE